MLNYTLQRLLQLIPILFGITFLSFLLMYMAGSDAVTEMYTNRGVEVAQEIIDAKKADLGLNLPSSSSIFLAPGDAARQYGHELCDGRGRAGILSAKTAGDDMADDTIDTVDGSDFPALGHFWPLSVTIKRRIWFCAFAALSAMRCRISLWPCC